jgi:hypothetical protein
VRIAGGANASVTDPMEKTAVNTTPVMLSEAKHLGFPVSTIVRRIFRDSSLRSE